MLGALQIDKKELSIAIVDDKQIQELNKVYRKKDRPTDVLAFAFAEGEHSDFAGPLLGDVVLSVERVGAQAAERGVSFEAELYFLLAHGILHLLGWDHDTPKKDRAMREKTEWLCAESSTEARTPRLGKSRALSAGKKTPSRK
jgi:probable rRNA maturation factor